MGILIGLVVLIALGVMAYGVFALGFIGWVSSSAEKTRDRAEEILDGLFDGTSRATYRVHLRALPYETVVLGGEDRGYTLSHETDNHGVKVLIFKLTDPAKVPARPEPESVSSSASASPDRTGMILAMIGVGLVVAGLMFASAIPQVATIGYLALALGFGFIVYGVREHGRARSDAAAHSIGTFKGGPVR